MMKIYFLKLKNINCEKQRNNKIYFWGSLEISGLSKGLEKIILAFNELVKDGKLTKIVFQFIVQI